MLWYWRCSRISGLLPWCIYFDVADKIRLNVCLKRNNHHYGRVISSLQHNVVVRPSSIDSGGCDANNRKVLELGVSLKNGQIDFGKVLFICWVGLDCLKEGRVDRGDYLCKWEKREENERGEHYVQTSHIIIDNLINFRLIYHFPVMFHTFKINLTENELDKYAVKTQL